MKTNPKTALELLDEADNRFPYVCSGCGAEDVKLWRQSHVFLSHIELRCLTCCEEHEGKKLDYPRSSDQIGGWIPAVPTSCRLSFWGYTSVPDEGVAWWHSLPPSIR